MDFIGIEKNMTYDDDDDDDDDDDGINCESAGFLVDGHQPYNFIMH